MWGPDYWLNDDFSALYADAENQYKILAQRLLKASLSPDKAKALGSHIAHIQHRVGDVHRILRRLALERRALASLDAEIEKQMPAEWPPGTPYPNNIQELFKEQKELTGYLELDIETLYQFGAVLLDQWAYVVAYIGGWSTPEERDFARLVQCLENPKNKDFLASIANSIYLPNVEVIHRLNMQFRLYRNKFIVHRTKPWQRSSRRDFIQGEYILWSPILPGSYTQERQTQLIQQVLDVASRGPSWFIPMANKANSNYLTLLHQMIRHSHEWSLADRNRLIDAASSLGFETETFQALGECLLSFIRDTVPQVIALGEDVGTLPKTTSP